MKKLILIILFFISTLGQAQYPIIEEFNAGTTWVYTNGSGMQNYGGAENYATFNIGNTPYPNGSTIRINSPLYDLTTCTTTLIVYFPIEGEIENTYDYMYFEYFNAGVWTILGTFTGIITPVTTYSYIIPNTTTRIRFRLKTDASYVVWYKPNGTYDPFNPFNQHGGYNIPVDLSTSYITGTNPLTTSVYYYDITRVMITCTGSLPIELLNFSGKQNGSYNLLTWITATEINNDFFTIERSIDANNFFQVGIVDGAGNSISNLSYSLEDTEPYDGVTYYRLTQTDYNGQSKTFNIIAVSRTNTGKNLKVVKITNLIGQEVSDDVDGVKIYYFNDGSTIKKCKIKN